MPMAELDPYLGAFLWVHTRIALPECHRLQFYLAVATKMRKSTSIAIFMQSPKTFLFSADYTFSALEMIFHVMGYTSILSNWSSWALVMLPCLVLLKSKEVTSTESDKQWQLVCQVGECEACIEPGFRTGNFAAGHLDTPLCHILIEWTIQAWLTRVTDIQTRS